ncbi:MAG: sulfite exporter TauE/SafE family protein [Acidimicrobiales bacterium]
MDATWIMVGGSVIGLLYGVFGVGSAFATPMLALLGVPGMAAVVGPLPALLPGSAAGAWSYSRQGKVDWVVARRALAGGLPAAIVGALASSLVGGPVLLVFSGLVLLVVGLRVHRPVASSPASVAKADRRRESAAFVVVAAILVGLASGLLANGGGFLLVPLFLLLLGLDMNQASGTSLVVASALTVPTLLVHIGVGDIDYVVASAFAVGLVPGAFVGARLATYLPTHRLQRAFGVLLVIVAVWFLARQAIALT